MPGTRNWCLVVSMVVVLLIDQVGRSQHVTQDVGAPAPAAQTVMARWDVLLNESGMDPIDQVPRQAIDTKSVLYHASMYSDAAALRAAILTAKSTGGLEGAGRDMAVSQNPGGGGNTQLWMNRSLYFNFYDGTNDHPQLNGNGNGQETLTLAADGKVHANLDYKEMYIRFVEAQQRNELAIKEKPAILFDGDVSPGQALGMMASFKGSAGQMYYHLIVWEAIGIEQRYAEYIQHIQASDVWCNTGPDGIRAAADVAAVWASGAKHDPSQVSPKWERKLEDGKTLRLIGLTRTDKWWFCWWDADGQPVTSTSNAWIDSQQNSPHVFFNVECHGDAEEWKRQTPTNNPGPNRQNQNTGEYQSINMFPAEGNKAIVGVPVGQWEQIGQIPRTGGQIKIGADTWRLRRAQGNGEYFYVDFQRVRVRGQNQPQENDIIALSAVADDNTELDPQYISQLTTHGYGDGSPNFQGMDVKKVKLFHVWRRKRQWITFEDVPAEPITEPPDKASPETLAAAFAAKQQRDQQAQVEEAKRSLDAVKQARAEWEAIPADPTTAKGALRALFKAAKDGDVAAVRKRFIAKQPDAGPMLDLTAQMLADSQSLWAMAVAHFGEAEIAGLSQSQNGMPLMMNFEDQLVRQPWQPTPDGGLQQNDVVVTKGEDGEYYLDISKSLEHTPGEMGVELIFRPMIARAQRMKKLLNDNPAMTPQQFREAISQPAPVTTAPATTNPA
jgi:hypothetical protein